MRLRTLLTGCVALVLAAVGTRLVFLAADARESALLERQRVSVEVIARDAVGLLVLTQDYLLHANPRALRQWDLVHRELSDALRVYDGVSDLQRDSAEDLLKVADNLQQLMAGLRQVQTEPDAPAKLARRETLADQLVNETRRISDGAFEISTQLSERLSAATRSQRIQAIVNQGVLLGVTLLLAWVLLRRVLVPAARLQRGAELVQAGDLSARIGYSRGDELGRMAQAFDAMAEQLQQRETMLKTARHDLQNILDAVPSLIGYWDRGLTCRFANRAYHDWFGVEPASLPGRHIADLLGEALFAKNLPYITAALRGEEQTFERAIPHPDGSGARHSLARYLPDVVDGAVRGFYVLVFDVTPLKLAQQQLEIVNAEMEERTRQAESASLAKSQFLSNMSHEIRSPMNAVMGLTYLLGRTRLDTEQQALLAKVGVAGRTLLAVINDVLDLSKIEAGELELEQAPVDLRRLVQELADCSPMAAERGIELVVTLAPELPGHVLGDAMRLRQVLGNLLDNALKFTTAGRVQLAVDIAQRPDALPRLRCLVQDTGIGMPAEVVARLFTPFTQADASTTRRFGGTGLGLSIVKRLVDLMEGEVRVSSSPGKGSTFEVYFPFVACPAEAVGEAVAPIQLLMAQDDSAQRDALQLLATRLGWRTEWVDTGSALIDHVRRRRTEGRPVDALVVDWRLPGVDGLEALAVLQDDDGAVHAPAVLLVTAAERAAFHRAPHAELADALVEKPVDASALFNAVHTALTQHGGDPDRMLRASALHVAGVAQLPGLHILVADDSSINLDVARHILELEGARVSVAQDGAAAVALLRAAPQDFDAVLMDVQMPVLDGLDATRQIRDELGLTGLPLVALTAGALLSQRQRALLAGMDSFVTKPFDPQALVRLLHRLVERARGERLPLTPRRATSRASAASWPALPGIDRADVEQRLEGDLMLFHRLLERMLSEFSDMASWAGPGTDADSPAAIEPGRLHKLAGSAGLLGAKRLQATASNVERILRQGPLRDEVRPALVAVGKAMQEVVDAAAPWCAQARAQRAEVPRADEAAVSGQHVSCDPETVAAWQQQLRVHDLGALTVFKEIRPALLTAMGEQRFKVLEEAIGRLAFGEAVALLDARVHGSLPATCS